MKYRTSLVSCHANMPTHLIEIFVLVFLDQTLHLVRIEVSFSGYLCFFLDNHRVVTVKCALSNTLLKMDIPDEKGSLIQQVFDSSL